ncbi:MULTISPECIES: helix-turn-helix transcriptional regulator [Sphingobium]|jgi:putative transcriptional regulator|uniref:Helix-turn-helix transcriptional regulator n=1 Tax=Sphingobium limneticum TaxID=1007511 RepID=A0A5J5HSR0_9SPHN|nr:MULTISPECIES: helix-turn-helix transcriptional regulator [Sphingobium]MBU0931083.1 helix-turn-helix transcriptional regulator [Alphaproteobacteria bacterium]KAA9012299.1 helix-turn-helix transcriptional regulator [Sphingobium limneticum]KAA9013304.1 helix-turn-helix transcriptional regulator [Sphingobium limneticum]KAA9025610.1 helix-turn-helix transcriptional regulator [Sphingobium limneticum]BBD00838.1 putative transcriptional regulator [Sphingobium sp. YG1]
MTERLLNGLREERDRLGLTQAELAQRVGVSRKTINTIENLVFSPSALLAIRIAQVIGKPVEALFWIGDAG